MRSPVSFRTSTYSASPPAGMKLYYAKLPGGNFGDDLNPWMWEKLVPGLFDGDNTTVFVGIGTILNSMLDNARFKVVFGSGTGYGPPPRIDEKWKIYCVRGPLTAQKLGIDKRLAITDAAYLLRYLPLAGAHKRYPVSFMCHHASEPDVDWQGLCDKAGIHNISPTAKLEDVLDELMASEMIIAEAMHGAIIADAFRIPWIPVRYGYRSFDFKWHDWCQSIGLRYESVDFPPILQAGLDSREKLGRIARLGLSMTGIGKSKWRRTPIAVSSQREIDAATDFLRKLAASTSSVLSADDVHAGAVERLRERLEDL